MQDPKHDDRAGDAREPSGSLTLNRGWGDLRPEPSCAPTHVDVTVIRLLDGTKLYLHGVLDNFSRRILAWHLAENGQTSGPFTMEQIAQGISTGRIRAETLVWTAGMPAWTAAGQAPQLAGLFQAAPPPPPSETG